MTNPLTQDTDEAFETIRKQHPEIDMDESQADDSLTPLEKQEAVVYWLSLYHQKLEEGDTREMTRLTGFLEEIRDQARDVQQELEKNS